MVAWFHETRDVWCSALTILTRLRAHQRKWYSTVVSSSIVLTWWTELLTGMNVYPSFRQWNMPPWESQWFAGHLYTDSDFGKMARDFSSSLALQPQASRTNIKSDRKQLKASWLANSLYNWKLTSEVRPRLVQARQIQEWDECEEHSKVRIQVGQAGKDREIEAQPHEASPALLMHHHHLETVSYPAESSMQKCPNLVFTYIQGLWTPFHANHIENIPFLLKDF